MATLTLPPTNAAGQAPTQEGSAGKPADGAADPAVMDSGWVVLGKSDVVPADLAAAAAAAGHQRLNFSPLPMLPIWVQMVLGGVVYTAVPFYKRARKIEGETLSNVETTVEVVEHVAEVTEKLAANAADSLPENGSLQKLAVEIEYIADVVDKDAHKVEAVIKKENSDHIIMANTCPLVAVLVASYMALSSARTFTVGDDQGWMSGIDYTDWTSGKTFAVGDKLLFSYGSQEHTVTEVSRSGYYACSGAGALGDDDTSGWTVVTLTGPGTRYFICNITGLCSSGMKLAVTVAESGGTVPSGASGGQLIPAAGSAAVVATAVLIKLFLF